MNGFILNFRCGFIETGYNFLASKGAVSYQLKVVWDFAIFHDMKCHRDNFHQFYGTLK